MSPALLRPLTSFYPSFSLLLPSFPLSSPLSLPSSLLLSLTSLLPSPFPQTLNMEEDTKSLKGQLLTVCPALEQLPSLDPLLGVWQGVRVRMFMHYQLSARAYFTFLKLSGTQSDSSPGTHVHVYNVMCSCTHTLYRL